MFASFHRIRLPLVALGIALALGACAKNGAQQGLNGGPMAGQPFGPGAVGAPGSVQEFQSQAVGDRVWFDTDSSSIDATGQETLNKQAQWLNLYPRYAATIEGHADERGTEEYNLALSARRAQAVEAYLEARGVGAARLKTIPYGKSRPVVVCKQGDDPCQHQNRRAVTVLSGG